MPAEPGLLRQFETISEAGPIVQIIEEEEAKLDARELPAITREELRRLPSETAVLEPDTRMIPGPWAEETGPPDDDEPRSLKPAV